MSVCFKLLLYWTVPQSVRVSPLPYRKMVGMCLSIGAEIDLILGVEEKSTLSKEDLGCDHDLTPFHGALFDNRLTAFFQQRNSCKGVQITSQGYSRYE